MLKNPDSEVSDRIHLSNQGKFLLAKPSVSRNKALYDSYISHRSNSESVGRKVSYLKIISDKKFSRSSINFKKEVDSGFFGNFELSEPSSQESHSNNNLQDNSIDLNLLDSKFVTLNAENPYFHKDKQRIVISNEESALQQFGMRSSFIFSISDAQSDAQSEHIGVKSNIELFSLKNREKMATTRLTLLHKYSLGHMDRKSLYSHVNTKNRQYSQRKVPRVTFNKIKSSKLEINIMVASGLTADNKNNLKIPHTKKKPRSSRQVSDNLSDLKLKSNKHSNFPSYVKIDIKAVYFEDPSKRVKDDSNLVQNNTIKLKAGTSRINGNFFDINDTNIKLRDVVNPDTQIAKESDIKFNISKETVERSLKQNNTSANAYRKETDPKLATSFKIKDHKRKEQYVKIYYNLKTKTSRKLATASLHKANNSYSVTNPCRNVDLGVYTSARNTDRARKSPLISLKQVFKAKLKLVSLTSYSETLNKSSKVPEPQRTKRRSRSPHNFFSKNFLEALNVTNDQLSTKNRELNTDRTNKEFGSSFGTVKRKSSREKNTRTNKIFVDSKKMTKDGNKAMELNTLDIRVGNTSSPHDPFFVKKMKKTQNENKISAIYQYPQIQKHNRDLSLSMRNKNSDQKNNKSANKQSQVDDNSGYYKFKIQSKKKSNSASRASPAEAQRNITKPSFKLVSPHLYSVDASKMRNKKALGDHPSVIESRILNSHAKFKQFQA